MAPYLSDYFQINWIYSIIAYLFVVLMANSHTIHTNIYIFLFHSDLERETTQPK